MRKKIGLFFFIAVCIPTIAISCIYLLVYSGEAKDRYTTSLTADLNGLSSQINSIMAKVDNLTLELSFGSNLNSMLLRPEQASMYDWVVLQNELLDKISLSGMISSAYVYFKANDKILTTKEGLYERDGFYDKDLIGRLLQSGGRGEAVQLRDSGNNRLIAPTEVLTVDRALPLSSKESLGYMVLNIDEQRFFSTFENLAGPRGSNVFVANLQDRSIFYHSEDSELTAALVSHLGKMTIPEDGETEIVSLSGKRYFVGYKLISSPGWLMIKVIPFSEYRHDFMNKVRSTLWIGLAIVLLGLALSYLFSRIIYRPWRDILTSYHNVFGRSVANRKLDEYALVSRGIDFLLTENSQIRQTMAQMEPMIKHKLIYDLLANRVQDSGQRQLLEQKGIHFPHPHFVVCLVDSSIEGRSVSFGKMELLLFSYVESAFMKRFSLAGTVLDEGRFAFILNLPEESLDEGVRQSLGETCRAVCDTVEAELNAHLQFSFGSVCDSIEKLYESYAHAKRGFKYKAVYDRTDVVFSVDAPVTGVIEYPVSLQKALVYSIKSMNRGKAEEAVSLLMQQFVYNGQFPPEKIHELMTIFVSAVISELFQDGYDLDELGAVHILQIDGCGNKEELETLIRDTVDLMIGIVESQEENRNDNQYVAKAISFIEKQYRNNISIGDIAEHVGLSPNYLSRIFKNETGHPPLDFLTRYRINRGKELLLSEKRYSLQEIGTMIGYNDVQSFNRFFKKYEAVTPSLYRKMGASRQTKGLEGS